MRGLAVALAGLWAATALAVAAAYRPGGPLDIVVALICFGPVLVAAGRRRLAARGRAATATAWRSCWLWIAARPASPSRSSTGSSAPWRPTSQRSLVPSAEAAYAGLLAVFAMALFSVTGFVHDRAPSGRLRARATLLADRSWPSPLTALIAAAFVLVVLINDEAPACRRSRRARATDPPMPTSCRPSATSPSRLGRHAQRHHPGDLQPRRRGARSRPS